MQYLSWHKISYSTIVFVCVDSKIQWIIISQCVHVVSPEHKDTRIERNIIKNIIDVVLAEGMFILKIISASEF